MSGTPLLDEEQAARLLSLLDSEDVQYRTMIKMFMFTGMRREELCGLEWKDIDFKASVIRIERASLYIPHEGIITDTSSSWAVLGRRIRLVHLDLVPPFVLSPPRRGASGTPIRQLHPLHQSARDCHPTAQGVQTVAGSAPTEYGR